MKKLITVLLALCLTIISMTGFCATKEEMEENFSQTWNTKLLGMDNIVQPLGIFAVKKEYNTPESLFLLDKMTAYNGQSEEEYAYYGVLRYKGKPKTNKYGYPSFFLVAARVDSDGYVYDASEETPVTFSSFVIAPKTIANTRKYVVIPYNITVQYDKPGNQVRKIANAKNYMQLLYIDTAAEAAAQEYFSSIKAVDYYPYR